MTAIHRSAYRDHRDPVRTFAQARQDRISNWEVNHGHRPVETLGQRLQATEVQQGLDEAERLRDLITAAVKLAASMEKNQPLEALFTDVSGELDGTLANFVHTIGYVEHAMDQAGIPARRA